MAPKPQRGGRGGNARGGAQRGGRGGNVRGGAQRGGRGGNVRGAPQRGRTDNARGGNNNNNTNNNQNNNAIARPQRPKREAPKVDFTEFQVLEAHELVQTKKRLLAELSSILIREGFETKANLKRFAVALSHYDPEFMLKVVLYSRDDLNLRTISNYMLAVCANLSNCQVYLKKYIPAIIRLPSDWLDVIDAFLALPERYTDVTKNSLPNALRRALIERFPRFDLYQLGKYNKEKTILKKQKKLAELGRTVPKKMTLKKAIKLLHISEPRFPVLAILGRKYPKEPEEWKKLGIYEDFDETKAGKRIKLPVAETWETLLSAKGNKGPTWEELIEHKKLPFMAMLRNLRNLIFTGVAPRYHRWAMNKLTSPSAIAMSRQFPFRFLNAYYAIPLDLEDFKRQLQELNGIYSDNEPAVAEDDEEDDEDLVVGEDDEEGAVGEKAEKKRRRRPRKNPIVCQVWPSKTLFNEYRAALETSIRLATIQNLKPIGGRTVVFIAPSNSTCGTSGALGSVQKVKEVGILLGLMLSYATESGEFFLNTGNDLEALQIDEGSILENIKSILEKVTRTTEKNLFPAEFLQNAINSKRRIDNLIMIGTNFTFTSDASALLARYRELVYPDMLFVSVDLTGKQVGIHNAESSPNDVLISGFSDSILRFVAERGDASQLSYIENIDKSKPLVRNDKMGHHLPAYVTQLESRAVWQRGTPLSDSLRLTQGTGGELESLMVSRPSADEWHFDDDDDDEEGNNSSTTKRKTKKLGTNKNEEDSVVVPAIPSFKPWKTAKVFISSTFVDMHGERDVLTRLVFPELRERCKKIHVNLLEVDLRWGVTQEETEENKSVGICLQEVERCAPFFVGLLGARYGWCPPQYHVSDDTAFDWVREYPVGRSITELEIQAGALRMGPEYSRALFYFRDPLAYGALPESLRSQFVSQGKEATKLQQLKEEIEQSDFPIFNYFAEFSGTHDHKPMMGKLDAFAHRVKEDLWNAITEYFVEDADEEEEAQAFVDQLFETTYHAAWMEVKARNFVGRSDAMTTLTRAVNDSVSNVISVMGAGGSGKSALVAAFVRQYTEEHPKVFVLPHFVGASPSSTDIRKTLLRLSGILVHTFALDMELGEDYQEICHQFAEIVTAVSFKQKIVLVIDGLDQFKEANRAHSLDWLPASLPIKVVVTCLAESAVAQVLHTRLENPAVHIGPLSLPEKTQIVRQTLAQYNKKLDESPMNDQMRPFLKKMDSAKPLYLALACHELRIFGVFEELENMISSLPATLPALLDAVLHRLEGDLGAAWLRHVLCLLLTSRGGLLEQEIMAILHALAPSHGSISSSTPATESALPSSFAHNTAFSGTIQRARWATTYSALEPFLRPAGMDDDGCIDLFHYDFRVTAARKYFGLAFSMPSSQRHQRQHKLSSEQVFYHQVLASYFDAIYRRTDYLHGAPDSQAVRALSELPHHLLHSQNFTRLAEVLTSLPFIQAKFALGFSIELIEDYQEVLAIAESSTSSGTATAFSSLTATTLSQIEEFSVFVFGNSHILKRFPQLTLQQALNAPDATLPAQVAARTVGQTAHMRWVSKPQDLNECRMTLPVTAPVTAITPFPDGLRIVAANKGSVASIFTTLTGAEGGALTGHSNFITCIDVSEDGLRIVTSSLDETLKVWDTETCGLALTIDKHNRRVSGCKFSPDGRYIISSSWDRTVRVFVAFSGEEVHTFSGHEKPINAFCLARDGKKIASADWKGVIKVWDFAERTELATLADTTQVPRVQSAGQPIRCVAFSPNGAQLFAGTITGIIKIFDLTARRVVAEILGHSRAIDACAFSQASLTFATGSEDAKISVWSAYMGALTRTARPPTKAARLHISLAPNGSLAALATRDGPIEILDTASLQGQGTLEGHTQGVNCTVWLDQTTLASASDDTAIILWDVASKKSIATLTGHISEVQDLAHLPHSKRPLLASAGFDTKVIVWDVNARRTFKKLKHQSQMKACAFSPDGQFLATGGSDGIVYLWSTFNWRISRSLRGHQDWVNTLAFSPNSQLLVSGSWDFSVRVWTVAEKWADVSFDDTKIEKKIYTLEGHLGSISSVKFTDGFIFSASYDGTIKVWNVQGGGEYTTLPGHLDKVMSVALHKNELYSVDESGVIHTWNPFVSTKLGALHGHSKGVTSLAFANDLIISGSEDSTLKVWDLKRTTWGGELIAASTEATPAVAVTTPTPEIIASALSTKTPSLLPPTTTSGANKTTKSKSLDRSHTATVAVPDAADVLWCNWNRNKTQLLTCTASEIQVVDWASKQVANRITKHDLGIPLRDTAWTTNSEYIVAAQERRLLAHSVLRHDEEPMNELLCAHIISSLAPHPDRWDLVATGDWGARLLLWNLRTSTSDQLVKTHKDWVTACAFAPNGNVLASAGYDKEVILHDFFTSKHLATFGTDQPLSCLSWSSNTYLAAGSTGGVITTWDSKARANRPLAQLQDPTNGAASAVSLAFSPDENYLLAATANKNGYLSVFDLRTHKMLSKFVSHSPLLQVSLKDLDTILVINTDGLLHLSFNQPNSLSQD